MPHENHFEDNKVTIRVKLVPNARNAQDSADLIIKDCNGDSAPINLRIKKEWIEHKHTFARVPDQRESYEFSYEVRHEGQTKQGDMTATVWPRTVNVKLLNVLDNQAMPNKHFHLGVGDNEFGYYKTDGNGVAQCKLKHTGVVQMRSRPELRFVQWVDGKGVGRNREALVERVEYRAAITAPDWAIGVVDHFVNVASAGGLPGHDHNGRDIRILVKLVDPRSPTARITPRGGERIYVKATLSELTARTQQKATLAGLQALDRAGDVITGYLTANAGTGAFTLTLGFGGLERCKLQIGTTPDCSDVAVEFINKRKVWIRSLSAPEKAPDMSDARRSLVPVGISLEEEDALTINPDTLPAGTVIPGDCFGATGDAFIVGTHNIAAVKAAWQTGKAPLGAYVIFADYQYDGAKNNTKTSASSTFSGSVSAWVVLSSTKNVTFLPIDLRNGNFAVNGAWVSLATQGQHAGAQGVLSRNDFGFDAINHPGKVKVTLPPEAADVVNAGESVRVTVNALPAAGAYNGWAPSNPNNGGVVIALKNRQGARKVSEMNQTVTHELGHMMGLVKEPTADTGLTLAGNHGWHYDTTRAHTGSHCATGISATVYNGGGSLADARGSCVMFGMAHAKRKGDLCDKCKPFLTCRTLEALS